MLLSFLLACDPADSADADGDSGDPAVTESDSWWHPLVLIDHLVLISEKMDYGKVLGDGGIRSTAGVGGCAAEQDLWAGWAAASEDLAAALEVGEPEFCAAVPDYLATMVDLAAASSVVALDTINVAVECPSDAPAGDCLTDGEFSFAAEDEEAYGSIRRGGTLATAQARADSWDAESCAFTAVQSDPEDDDSVLVSGTVTIHPFHTTGPMDVAIEAGTMNYGDWLAAVSEGDSGEATGELNTSFTAEYCPLPDVAVLAI